MTDTMVLPTAKRKPVVKNPRVLLVYSQPKAGKTSVLAGLEGNLIVDLDPLGGADFLEALSVRATTLEALRGVLGALWELSPFPYCYLTLDPLTDLETAILPLACELYQKTPMGKAWRPVDERGRTDYGMILTLPNGAGYGYLRDAFFQVVNAFAEVCKANGARLILSAHIRDKFIVKEGKDVATADVNLTGKLRNLVCGWVDAIGYLRRQEQEAYLVFRTSDEVNCGARSPHLTGKEILISRNTGTPDHPVIETYWDSIFIPEN